MTWVKIDDGFPQHPKILKAGPLAMAMQIAALCYSARYLTDGFIPGAALGTLIDLTDCYEFEKQAPTAHYEVASWLVGAGVWDVVEEGYQIHDYEEYQPTKADVLYQRAAKVAAGRAGGIASAKAGARQKLKQEPGNASSKTTAEQQPVPVPVPVPVITAAPDNDPDRIQGESVLPPRAPARLALLSGHFEDEIGSLTPAIADQLQDWADRIPDDKYIGYAFGEAATNGSRSWKYVEAILKRLEEAKWPALDKLDDNGRESDDDQIDWLEQRAQRHADAKAAE